MKWLYFFLLKTDHFLGFWTFSKKQKIKGDFSDIL